VRTLGRVLFALAVGLVFVLVIRYVDQSISHCILNGGNC